MKKMHLGLREKFITEKIVDYFNVGKEVKQEDPLSSELFILAFEEKTKELD